MNLLADECSDALVVDGLRGDGHDVLYVREVARGSDDDTVLQMAADQQRILLTEDKDFGELVVRLKLPAHGDRPTPHEPRRQRCEASTTALSSTAPRPTPAPFICRPPREESPVSFPVNCF